MSDKKRKRDSEKGERSPKKVAVDAPPNSIKVSFVKDDDELCPVVASTPGLSFPTNVPFKAYKKRKTDTRPLPPGSSSAYELLLQSSAHPRLDYTAREEQDGTADSLLKHYVGVYDPQTRELKVMEAHKLVVRSVLRSDAAEATKEAKKPTQSALRQTLGLEFGTKKAKKAIASLTENAINPTGASQSTADLKASNPLAAAVLDSVAQTTSSMPTRTDLQAAVDEAKLRPKANLAATTPAEVYPLDTLISPEEMKAIPVKDWQEAAQQKQGIQVHSRYVARRMNEIALAGDVKRLKVLRYVGCLVEFNAALKVARSGGKRLPQKEDLDKKIGLGAVVVSGIKRKFVDGVELTKWHVDNLMTHIAALSLIVDNFDTDMHDLREDLKLDSKQITQYYHEIGCKITLPTETERARLKIHKHEAKSHRIAKLRIPLDFPKQRVLAQKRR